MRIVHIITRFIRGGADENTLLTCNGQAQLGHDVHLIAGDHHPEMIDRLDPRVQWHHLPSLKRELSPFNDPLCLAQLSARLRRLAPDIVHTHESKAGILGRLAARLAGVSIIVHGVHILPFVNVSRPVALLYLALEKLAARSTDAYVSVSQEMQNICIAHGLGTPDIHMVAPSGMDLSSYRDAAPIARDTLVPGIALVENVTIGLIAGHLERRKRIADLINALGRSLGGGDWVLLVAGEGPERDELSALIAQLGLGERVFLLGFRADLPRLLASVDFVVHAATNEGLPRVVVQAVLAGKPVVAPALPGIENVVVNGRNGLLAPVDSFERLAELTLEMAQSPTLRARFVAAARDIDLSPWETDAMVQKIETVYGNALSRGRSRRGKRESFADERV